MRIITVIENKSTTELDGEWGLCIYIEYEGKKYLLDSGATDKFLINAKALERILLSERYKRPFPRSKYML